MTSLPEPPLRVSSPEVPKITCVPIGSTAGAAFADVSWMPELFVARSAAAASKLFIIVSLREKTDIYSTIFKASPRVKLP
jgi:hypothetical protein